MKDDKKNQYNITWHIYKDPEDPYGVGAPGSIPGFSSLSDETKPWPHMTLAVGRILKINIQRFLLFCNIYFVYELDIYNYSNFFC